MIKQAVLVVLLSLLLGCESSERRARTFKFERDGHSYVVIERENGNTLVLHDMDCPTCRQKVVK